jgi:hypothetical protein
MASKACITIHSLEEELAAIHLKHGIECPKWPKLSIGRAIHLINFEQLQNWVASVKYADIQILSALTQRTGEKDMYGMLWLSL